MTVIELIHEWANKKLDAKGKEISGWSADKRELFNGFTRVGYHYDNFTIILAFSGGGWAGYNDRTIREAMPHNNFMLVSETPHNIFNKKGHIIDVERFQNYIRDEFISANEYAFNHICTAKDFITNNRRKVEYGDLKPHFRLKLADYIRDNHMDLINDIPIKHKVYGKIYKGWGIDNYNTTPSYYFDTTIGQLLKNKITDHFTRKEQYEFRFKKWRLIYCHTVTPGTAKKYYTDKDTKAKVEEAHAQRLKAKEALRQKILARERENKAREKLSAALNWIGGVTSYSYTFNYYLNYDILRLKDDKVQTSGGVTIDVDKAKLLYKYIKANRDKFKEGFEFPYKLKTILGYTIKGIESRYINYITDDYKSIDNDSYMGITIGCHFIPLKEIDRFIEYNNLSW